jgi:hypothetical protein
VRKVTLHYEITLLPACHLNGGRAPPAALFGMQSILSARPPDGVESFGQVVGLTVLEDHLHVLDVTEQPEKSGFIEQIWGRH